MAVKLLFLWLLFCLSWAQEQRCLQSASSCDECIQAGSGCAWCNSPQAHIRCATTEKLWSSGCHGRHIYNPSGSIQVVKNYSGADPADDEALLLHPQEVSLHLRPGVSESFPLTISKATDHPTLEPIMNVSNVPAGVHVTFSSITKGNPQLLQVSVEAAQCPSKSGTSNQNKTGPWSILITPRGFSVSLKLEITLLCECNCTGSHEENSPDCSGHGTLVCGQCECYVSYFGKRCQMNGDSVSPQYEDLCRKGPNAPVCSGRGTCVAGFCECNRLEDPKEYSGRYCECSNFDCPHHNNRLCGGNGRCECGRCVCNSEWIDSACSCSMETTSCMAKNQMLCNGRGVCECGKCDCIPPYVGATCEECSDCVDGCQDHAACMECRAFRTGAKKDTCDRWCAHLNVEIVETKDELQGKLCKMRTNEDLCYFFFSILPSGGQFAVARAKEC
ncbi:integrin beta-1-like [Xiphophorus maculatus]|uniref:integrin beta-1-like n=1 Tax=Xiphophorus maculatus TaxID=8083 RepID=UPI000293E17A|nr:integrin beta-1-like [Xiphophorus maculatus]